MILSIATNNYSAVNYVVLFAYIAILVAIAIYSSKKASRTNDFFLGSRGIGGWMSAFAYGTTYFSAVVFIGYAGKFGWTFGSAAVWIGIGNAIIGSYVAWKILAKRTRKMTQWLNSSTMPEFFAKRYDDKWVKLVSSIVIFIFLIPYSASVYQGIAYLFQITFNIPYLWCVLILAGVTALYVFFGGYFGTAVSNFFQGIVMLVGIVAIVIILLVKSDGVGSFDKLQELGLRLFASTDSVFKDGSLQKTGFFNSTFVNMAVILLLTSFGIWAVPQSVHKFYAIKDESAIKKGTIISTLFAAVVGCGCYFIGTFAHYFLDAVPNGNTEYIIPTMLQNTMPYLMGFILVLALSASMSTLSSLALCGASSISIDMYKGYAKKKPSQKKTNWVFRIVALLFIAVSVVLSLVSEKIEAIVALMGLSWGTLAGCFIGPYVLGLYSKKVNKVGMWASIIGTLVITFILVPIFGKFVVGASGFWNVVLGGIKYSPHIGVICMAYSMIITPIASLIFKNQNQTAERVAEIFSVLKNGAAMEPQEELSDIEKEADIEANIEAISDVVSHVKTDNSDSAVVQKRDDSSDETDTEEPLSDINSQDSTND